MRKNSIVVLALVILLSAVGLSSYAQEDLFDTKASAEHVDKGMAFLKANKLNSAINEFEEAAAINPSAESYYYLGYALYLKGKKGDVESRKSSKENFDKAYELDPNFSPSRIKPTEATLAKPKSDEQKSEPAATPAPVSAVTPTPEPMTQQPPVEPVAPVTNETTTVKPVEPAIPITGETTTAKPAEPITQQTATLVEQPK